MKNNRNILLYSILFLLFILTACKKEKQFDGYLYPIKENGLYGYIDSVSNRIIEPQFLWASPFSNGLAMAVVDTIYRDAPDSMAYEVGERDSVVNLYRMYAKYGYIDKRGRFAIKPTFVTYVTMPEKGYIVNDMTECRNALSRYTFHSRRALFCDTITWKNGYINNKGKIVIEPRYYYSDPFGEGLAVVRDAVAEPLYTNKACVNPSKLRCAYIDTLGNAVTEFKYESLTSFRSSRGIGNYKKINKETIDIADTTIIYETFNTLTFLINGYGKEIKELDYNYDYYGFSRNAISVASDGLFLRNFVGKEDMSYYFIDTDGEFLKPLKGLSDYQLDSLEKCKDIMQVLPNDANISAVTFFNEGFAGISPDKKHWFVIDKHLLIHGYGEESIFDAFKPFSCGFAAVKRNGKWGYINRKIKEQIPCKYDSCGLAYPSLEEIFEYDIQGNIAKIAYINRNDSLVWESKVPKVGEINNKYFGKEKKNWGKWINNKNVFQENIQIWNLLAFCSILFVLIALWRKYSKNTPNKQAELEQTAIASSVEDTLTPIEAHNNDFEDDIQYYPSVGKYTETIKMAASSPDEYFEKLSNLHPVLDKQGDPVMSSGNFAVVFKMVDDKGKYHAVRCFHREQEGRERSYKLICEELAKVSSPYLLPIQYFEKELFIDSVEYPVLLMDWADGLTLDKYIRKHINDKTKLRSLAENFRQLAIWLLSQPFAHGDLKPDNIIVKADGSFVLVDYDGMFVPAMEGQNARELGSPDFRSPVRTENDFDKNIDDFPLVSILLSLELLVENKEYLSKYGEEDRLLFSEDDYRNIDNNVLFRIALSSYNNDISELAINLKSQLSSIHDNNIIPLLGKKEIRCKQKQKNEKIEKRLIIVIILYNLFIPLGTYIYSRIIPITDWNPLGVSIGILSSAFFLYFVMVIIDFFRPYKESHLYIDEDYTSWGCIFSLWDIFIAFGLILNSLINCVWYITILIIIIWICFFYILSGITYGAFELRTCIYKTPTEKRIEIEKKEKDKIRTNLRKEEQRQKEAEMNEEQKERYYNDDLPF